MPFMGPPWARRCSLWALQLGGAGLTFSAFTGGASAAPRPAVLNSSFSHRRSIATYRAQQRTRRRNLTTFGSATVAAAATMLGSGPRNAGTHVNAAAGDRGRQSGGPNGSDLPFLYGTAWKKEATTDLVVQAVRAGFRGIDTACQPKHYSEDLVGAALARLAREDGVPREALWIQTKFTPLRGQDPARIPYDPNAPLPTQVEQSIQRSLQNLGTTYIDSLVLHSPLPTLEGTLQVWRVFEKAVDAGTVTQLGISNCYDLKLFKDLYAAARIKPKVLQNRFYQESDYDMDLRAFCAEVGVTYQSFWTLTANPHILSSGPVEAAARRLGATPAQVLFRWMVQAGHQPLTGTKSMQHMQQDLAVVDLELSATEMLEINKLFCKEPSRCTVS